LRNEQLPHRQALAETDLRLFFEIGFEIQ
jgi:hypothetical protein